MNSYLAKRGLGTLALPLAVVVALAPAGFTSCGDKATGPSGGPPTYQGVFAGGTGESGVLKVRVPAGNPPDVTGSLTFVGGGDVNLTGTLDQSTGALSLIGGGYTITGNVVTGGLDGKYTGPAGSGQFATLKNSTTRFVCFAAPIPVSTQARGSFLMGSGTSLSPATLSWARGWQSSAIRTRSC